MFERLSEWLSERGTLPNKLTIGMGELVRQAREEAGLSQTELAKRIYRRQAALSDIEHGKMRIDAETLVYLAYALNKPVHYFFPDQLTPKLDEDLSAMEAELLTQARRLPPEDLHKLIVQAKALADIDQ
jgi:transcriptional regulator with XRE-family HTH domain